MKRVGVVGVRCIGSCIDTVLIDSIDSHHDTEGGTRQGSVTCAKQRSFGESKPGLRRGSGLERVHRRSYVPYGQGAMH